MITPDSDFRPNPARAVFVQGVIDQQLVDRLLPQIVRMQQQNRAPITVYIDSPGGRPASGELLLRLLKVTDQDCSPACRVITVATARAASAAADLLSWGDYAIAFPNSTILYHGTRRTVDDPITVEAAATMAESLKLRNDRFAMRLARRHERFFFRYVTMRPEFGKYRTDHGKPNLSPLGCFVGMLRERLSQGATQVADLARSRNARYEALSARLSKSKILRSQIERLDEGVRIGQVEATVIKIITDFALSTNRNADWSFLDDGLRQVRDDFMLFLEMRRHRQSPELSNLFATWGDSVLTGDEQKELATLPEGQRDEARVAKLRPEFAPVWLFFVSLCHALQEGENDLSGLDAYWLGMIDEVIGETLPSFRLAAEFMSDAPQTAPAAASAP